MIMHQQALPRIPMRYLLIPLFFALLLGINADTIFALVESEYGGVNKPALWMTAQLAKDPPTCPTFSNGGNRYSASLEDVVKDTLPMESEFQKLMVARAGGRAEPRPSEPPPEQTLRWSG